MMGMALVRTFVKDPDEVLDFGVDWSTHLGTDTIDTSAWVVPAGITEDSSTNDTTSTTIWLSGGTANTDYTLVNRIVTVGGRTIEASLRVMCRSTD